MTDQIIRIRKTWAQAVLAREVLGQIFYQKLFEIAPETREMFPAELDAQGRKLVQTLSWIVDHLDQPDALTEAAGDLALRHVGYGVKPAQYQAVGAALISTLQAGLGANLTDADEAAWVSVYQDLSGLMIAKAYPD